MTKKVWITEGFESFGKGKFGNSGQNIYVSKNGILQRIFQYDLDRDGYIDLVYANCQNHNEVAPTYVYSPDGTKKYTLPGQGSVCGMICDIYGSGYQDIIVTGYYDLADPFASTDIYFGTSEGYSEKYHIRIPTPWATDCDHGDFNGKGYETLVFSMPLLHKVRLFERTRNNCIEWDGYIDLDITADFITVADIDNDGYDDLIYRKESSTETTILWGSPNGLSLDNKTVLPALPESEMLQFEEEIAISSNITKKSKIPCRLQSVVWNGRECFTISTGKKVIFYSANCTREIVRHFEIDVPMAVAVAVGDIDGDGFEDIAVASDSKNKDSNGSESSFIIWNSPSGIDKRPRTVIDTKSASDVYIMDGHVLFAQANIGHLYTNESLLFTYPDFKTPQTYIGEDTRRGMLINNNIGEIEIVLINHHSRSSIGSQKAFIYHGSSKGYSTNNRTEVPCHCAVDALIADFNDDGWAELLIANNSENAPHLDVGHYIHYFGENGFEPEKTQTIKTNLGWGVAAGDFNKDGYLEVATSANNYNQLRIYSAKDNFSSCSIIKLPKGCTPRWPQAIDLNMDGWLDLILPCGTLEFNNTLILWGGPDGFSYEHSTELATRKAICVTAADLTQNGYPDLIIGCHVDTPHEGNIIPHQPHHSFVHIYWNGPEGIAERRKCILRSNAADHITVADFNRDGWLDIFVGNYHNGKERDIDSYLYWNRNGEFSEFDCQFLPTHSASGCMAADFNEDGYIDLAIANHKVNGDHVGCSTVWWNSPIGFNDNRITDLPTEGPHGMISAEIGNIIDRSMSEYYYSECYTVDSGCRAITDAYAIGDIPPKTSVNILIKKNGGNWQAPNAMPIAEGDIIEYRVELYAFNCLRTPRIEKIVIEME